MGARLGPCGAKGRQQAPWMGRFGPRLGHALWHTLRDVDEGSIQRALEDGGEPSGLAIALALGQLLVGIAGAQPSAGRCKRAERKQDRQTLCLDLASLPSEANTFHD